MIYMYIKPLRDKIKRVTKSNDDDDDDDDDDDNNIFFFQCHHMFL